MLYEVITYGGKMWVIAGQSGYIKEQKSDVWSSSDGVNWELVRDSAPFGEFTRSNNIIVHKNAIWVIGGYNSHDIWKSP